MKEITLSRNKTTVVDNENFDELSKYKWYFDGYYAVRNEKTRKNKTKIILMHRQIMREPKGKRIDHEDGNGLNNQKYNLRLCSHAENMRNSKKPINNTSGYKGVHFNKKAKKFQAYISVDNKNKHLGLFNNPIDAALAYNNAAKKLHGKFANLNNI